MLSRSALLLTIVLSLLAVGCDTASNTGPGEPTPSLSRDTAPAWSPDGTRIAYAHVQLDPDAPGAYPTGLYVLDLGSGARTLVAEGNVSNPDWSPDGEWLAFDAGDVFVARADGRERRRVTDFGSAFFPAWSPDGSRIAFDTSYEDPRGAYAIWIIDPDGGGLVDISEHGAGAWRDPDWSADGRIVHLRFLSGVFGEELFVMDSTGANAQRLTYNESNDRFPTWSPDGGWIAWQADTGVWLIRADGSEPRLLAAGGTTPAWSPDGERLVFSAPAPDGSRVVLWTIHRDGTGRQLLTP